MRIAALLVVAAVVAATVLTRFRTPDGATGAREATTLPDVVSSIAVLPFVNTGGDQKDEYFSDGMTDELAHALSRLRGLRVAGRSSSYAYKGKHLPAPEVGRALGVSALLEGTVRRSGDRLRITAQLTGTADGAVRWSDSYERGAGEVFALQDELTSEIVAALAPTLGATTPTKLAGASRGTNDPEAYDLYLRGHHFWVMRGEDNLVRAVAYFQRAVARDPSFARAHAGLAKTYAVMPFFMPDPADTLTLRGIESGERALALDSTLADAHLGIAAALSVRGQPREALPHELAAIALEPMNATAHQWHGDNLLSMGRAAEGAAALRKAVALDPLSSIAHTDLGIALISLRRFDEAIVAAQRSVELGGNFGTWVGALAHLFAGHADSAVALGIRYGRAVDDPSRSSAFLALAYAAKGRWDDVDRMREEVTRARAMDIQGVDAATVALAYGDRAPLVRVLLTPEGRRQWTYRWNTVGCSPLLDPLMTDPAFIAMLDRQGIARCPVTTPWPIRPRPGR